jgi:acetyl-CoA synthetase (ADP-forming)
VTVTLSEAESRRVVARHGVPVSPFVTGTTTDEVVHAVQADPAVVFPVVAKLCGRAIAHKTERGLVRLRLADTESLRRACDDLLGAARPDDGDVEVLVSTMVEGNRELIAGLATDPQFGLTVMLGVGGILAEAIRDVSFRLVPVDPIEAGEMIDDLSTQRLLGAFRGEPVVDRAALVDAVVALARVGAEVPGIASADLNPLILVDGRPVAVDALLEVDDAEAVLA